MAALHSARSCLWRPWCWRHYWPQRHSDFRGGIGLNPGQMTRASRILPGNNARGVACMRLLGVAAVMGLVTLQCISTGEARPARAAALLHAQSAASEKNMPAPAASQKFAQMSDQFLKESLALSPTNASYAGYH